VFLLDEPLSNLDAHPGGADAGPDPHEQHVVIRVGEALVTAKLTREHRFALGDKVIFTVDPCRPQLFDPATGHA
jgi:hypothetical protein